MRGSVDVLGTKYRITVKKYGTDPSFKAKSWDGYCDGVTKQIVLCDMRTWPDWEKDADERIEKAMKHTLRHEIVHAFLNESGLENSTFRFDGGWATAEEMVDWIALQGPKIWAAWQAAGAV